MNFEFPQKHPHEIVFFFYPSPGLNWTNPRALTFSTIRNSLLGRPRAIGHVSVMVRTPEETEITGMTQRQRGEGRHEVLWHGYGMGILLHNFKGTLEDREKLAPELIDRSKIEKRLSFFRISVGESTTARVLQYIREFREKGYDRWYGMRNRPLYGEGGGCGPFAASVLETAGLLSDEIAREWTRTVNVPHELIGGPITGKTVSVFTLLRRADRWAQEEEPHEKGHFWDPDLMHNWLVRTHAAEKETPTKYRHEQWNASPGIHLDATSIAAPTGKIFKI